MKKQEEVFRETELNSLPPPTDHMTTTRYIQNEVRHLDILRNDHSHRSSPERSPKKDLKSALIPITKK